MWKLGKRWSKAIDSSRSDPDSYSIPTSEIVAEKMHNLQQLFHREVGADVVVVVLSQDIFVRFAPVRLLLSHGQGSDVLVLETSVAFGGICVVVASRTCGASRQFGNRQSTSKNRVVEGTWRVTMQDRTPWQEHLRRRSESSLGASGQPESKMEAVDSVQL